ncbi:hypothetical protein [Yersinia ruckeri]|uniref:hypothetical protein n=1 Tax=Yersinia ruckeri TaxID=29486 RepID=UPI002237B03A|nr:hypothetical protein [Yersinia ruckeri]MCW6598661.1 hypothetical protein [Yersinia ruckeri]
MATLQDIENKRKEQRPFGYDRGTGDMARISSNFESFLIRAPDSLKTAIASHMETTAAGNIQNQLIRAKAIANFAEGRIKRQREFMEEHSDKVNKINDLVTKISQVGAGDISATSSDEKTNLIQDLQHGLLESRLIIRDTEFQALWMSYITQLDAKSPNAATVQRMRGWSNSLFAYPEEE